MIGRSEDRVGDLFRASAPRGGRGRLEYTQEKFQDLLVSTHATDAVSAVSKRRFTSRFRICRESTQGTHAYIVARVVQGRHSVATNTYLTYEFMNGEVANRGGTGTTPPHRDLFTNVHGVDAPIDRWFSFPQCPTYLRGFRMRHDPPRPTPAPCKGYEGWRSLSPPPVHSYRES